MNYSIHEDDHMGVILLRYKIDDRFLVTDQPSSPREERTRCWMTEDGRLVLKYGKLACRYDRMQ